MPKLTKHVVIEACLRVLGFDFLDYSVKPSRLNFDSSSIILLEISILL